MKASNGASEPKSKRTPVRLRHKIEKASAAKQRKQRKLSKANPEWRSRLKKDPGIPNLFPYKDRILHDIEEKKRLKEEALRRKREEAREAKGLPGVASVGNDAPDAENIFSENELIDDEAMDEDIPVDSNPLAALLASAKARAAEYEDAPDNYKNEGSNTDEDHSFPAPIVDSSARAFSKTFQSILSSSDVLLYVLDARDPLGTRSRHTERQIASASGGSKRLILILNKIDLVPAHVLKAWLVHLRRYFPTLPLRASTPAPNAKTYDHKALTQKNTAETLLRALKSYAATQNLKRAITVGVVGYPNVGKSSVINTLVSRLSHANPSRNAGTACPVGAEAGVTTAMREVKLDNKLKLLDSPGIVFPAFDSSITSSSSDKDNQARLTLLSAIPPKYITDPIPAIALLLQRLSSTPTLFADLLQTYNIPAVLTTDSDMTTDFLVQVARKRGRLGKGGVPNLTAAAMGVLGDWRDGRVKGWVEAPVLSVASGGEKVTEEGDIHGMGDDNEEEAGDRREIVAQWGKEFKLEGLWGDDEGKEAEEMDVG